jgi:hypothetical protein
MVSLLAEYDTQRGTNLASKAASAYSSILSAVYDHFDGSLAVKMVADKYTQLLSPYIHDNNGNEYVGNSSSSVSGNSNRKSACEKCIKAFALLDLPLGASDEEVSSKKRAFAELLHEDRLGAMSDSARRIAQEQHRGINGACDHILTCRVRAKLQADIHGSEPPPDPHQSANSTAKRKSKRQPPPASSDESKEEEQERGREVRSEKDPINTIATARKNVEEATRKTLELLEQLKKQNEASPGKALKLESMRKTNATVGTTTTIGGKLLP